MLTKILGCIWIAAAVLLFIRPQAYKKWLQKERPRKYIPLLPVIPGILLIYIGLKSQGLPANIVVILGWMSILKAAVILNAKAYNKIMDWALTLPLAFYRTGACIHIGIGLLLLSLR